MIEGAPGRFVGDRYHLVRELGRGGMGVVFLGRDLRLDMDVAIKFRGVTHSDATLWLKREFRAVASLRHPNLVELYELVAHDRSCYFTMEYLPGLDPRRWVEAQSSGSPPSAVVVSQQTTHSALPMQEALTETSSITGVEGPATIARPVPRVDFGRVRGVLAQLAEGLAFLHGCGVIHRDVKPSNAIVVDGSVKLLDFGLALEQRRRDEDLARETRVVGTAAYLAPEYVERLAVSPAMDVYALGVLAFELVTGAPPFGGTLHLLSRLQRQLVIPRAIAHNPEVPPELDELIDRMLAADPDQRPAALEVATALTGSMSQPRLASRALRFIGRAAELDRIATRIGDPAPHARLVLVTGPSGVGKTALIDEAVGRARDGDTVTWRGRCHERERVPYRAFDLIIDDLATELAGDPRLARGIAHAGALARVFPVLAPLIDPARPAREDAPPATDLRVERERALHAISQLFAQSMHAPRAVIVIDDLQWADDDSLELLALLVERVGRPLTIIASWTTEGPDRADPLGAGSSAPRSPRPEVEPFAASALPAALGSLLERLALAAEPCLDRIDVAAMPDDELAQLIADLAPRSPTLRLAAATRLAAGSPYLAELIGRELGAADVADPHDAELRRLERLDPTERAVAEIAALAGGAASFEQLKAVAELPSSRLQSVLRGLQDARIVRASPSAAGDPVYVFYHQRLRETAQASMTAEVRRARHERFAGWYERNRTTDQGQLAYHWQHAGEPARAASWAIAAAEAARAQLAWGIAADWYGKALELGAPDPIAARAGKAEMLFLGGKLALAAEEFLVLARVRPEDAAAGDPWRVRAAEAYLKLGELDRGLAVLDAVLARRGQRRTRTRAVSVMRAALVATRWLAPLPARRAPVDDVLAASYRVIASFLSTPHPIEALEYVLRGIALAERTGDHDAHSQGMAMLAAYLAAGSLGRFGDRALASARRLSSQSAAPYPRMVAAGATGIVAALRGDWHGMRIAHEEAERVCRRLGLERTWEASFLKSYWALGELYAGEPARSLAMVGELTEHADDLFSRAMLGSVRGRALVMAGDLDAARAVARELDRAPAARRGMASIYRQVFAGELALAEHAWDRALQIATELEAETRAQWLTAIPATSAMCDVIIATAELGRPGRGAALGALTAARRLYRRGRSSFYAATALRLWAQAEARLGHGFRSRNVLARASAVAAESGGRVDRLAIAALGNLAIDPGPLAVAVSWSTGGSIGART